MRARSKGLFLVQDRQTDSVRGQEGRVPVPCSHPALRIVTRALWSFLVFLFLKQLTVSVFTAKGF